MNVGLPQSLLSLSGGNGLERRAAHAAQQFEAIFLAESMRSARESAKLTDEDTSAAGSDDYREMADRAMAEALAAKGAFGIATTALKGLNL